MTKILIIEDTVSLRENITDALELEGFEVIGADVGKIGIQMAKENLPDLILCDIMMPGMDGYDVLQLLKSEDGELQIPFIFITALAERENFRAGMELGADDYLIKPFTIYELLKAINTRLAKSKSIEKRIKLQIEEIESELKSKISELLEQIKNQKTIIEDISATNTEVIGKLNENQTELMQEALRLIEINTTMQNMAKQLSAELQKKGIAEEQRQVLVDLKNKIQKKSVLLNSLTTFQLKFNQTYPNFISNLFIQFPQLTQQDTIIISAIFVNLDTLQLSLILGISPESVRKSKYRLKQKLSLGKHIDLTEFIHKLN
ncbi:DNA-binding response regulator, AraC family [Aquipluma nitroreducens]|uniref:DNA-binding response regulator, AraC family n=1 Tax=Aquipluma nitroreducens TaxID=2010828 RepID=A0A5K7S3Z2_9BACT|nr:response regulator [Aquipluma nitroreducens]BBE16195.1 DNA-binding response regulator, AraC family [Aquipluma nitroreducens]